jgi:hypothetical protein
MLSSLRTHETRPAWWDLSDEGIGDTFAWDRSHAMAGVTSMRAWTTSGPDGAGAETEQFL